MAGHLRHLIDILVLYFMVVLTVVCPIDAHNRKQFLDRPIHLSSKAMTRAAGDEVVWQPSLLPDFLELLCDSCRRPPGVSEIIGPPLRPSNVPEVPVWRLLELIDIVPSGDLPRRRSIVCCPSPDAPIAFGKTSFDQYTAFIHTSAGDVVDKALTCVFSKDRDFQYSPKTRQAKQLFLQCVCLRGEQWRNGGACKEVYSRGGVRGFYSGIEGEILHSISCRSKNGASHRKNCDTPPWDRELPRYFGISADTDENTRS